MRDLLSWIVLGLIQYGLGWYFGYRFGKSKDGVSTTRKSKVQSTELKNVRVNNPHDTSSYSTPPAPPPRTKASRTASNIPPRYDPNKPKRRKAIPPRYDPNKHKRRKAIPPRYDPVRGRTPNSKRPGFKPYSRKTYPRVRIQD